MSITYKSLPLTLIYTLKQVIWPQNQALFNQSLSKIRVILIIMRCLRLKWFWSPFICSCELTAAILIETVVTGLRKWRVCNSRSPMHALMLAHLERRRVWVSHVTCTLPPNDTFSLFLLKQVLSSFFGIRREPGTSVHFIHFCSSSSG